MDEKQELIEQVVKLLQKVVALDNHAAPGTEQVFTFTIVRAGDSISEIQMEGNLLD